MSVANGASGRSGSSPLTFLPLLLPLRSTPFARRIHCFENVNVLVFVAAISEYDQVLFEDQSVNRLQEATMLWESIAGSRWFEKSAFVLMCVCKERYQREVTG